MHKLLTVNWQEMFVPAMGLAEIILRGSLMYLILFLLLRFLGRRQTGHFGPADLLVIVLIADASQNALGAQYRSLTEGAVLVLTIVTWDYVLDWLAWRFPALRRLFKPPPLKLIEDGRVLYRNLRAEMLGRDDLMSQLREAGIEDINQVKVARLEGDGRLSVIKRTS